LIRIAISAAAFEAIAQPAAAIEMDQNNVGMGVAPVFVALLLLIVVACLVAARRKR